MASANITLVFDLGLSILFINHSNLVMNITGICCEALKVSEESPLLEVLNYKNTVYSTVTFPFTHNRICG